MVIFKGIFSRHKKSLDGMLRGHVGVTLRVDLSSFHSAITFARWHPSEHASLVSNFSRTIFFELAAIVNHRLTNFKALVWPD